MYLSPTQVNFTLFYDLNFTLCAERESVIYSLLVSLMNILKTNFILF